MEGEGEDKSFDLFDIDASESSWFSLRIPGKLPPRRTYHLAAVNGIFMYVMGGIDVMEGSFSDTWRISLEDFQKLMRKEDLEKDNLWELLPTSGAPPGRISNHKGIIIDQTLFLYGGEINSGNSAHSLFKLDLPSNSWSSVTCETEPPGRDGHSLVASAEGLFYIFGGFVGGKCVSELWQYDPTYNKFARIKEEGPWPEARANHSANLYTEKEGEELMIVAGGINQNMEKLSEVWAFRFSTQRWEQWSHEADVFTARSEHSTVIYGSHLIVFGGRCEKEMNDLLALNIETKNWRVLSETCFYPSPDKSYLESKRIGAISELRESSRSPDPSPLGRTAVLVSEREPEKRSTSRTAYAPIHKRQQLRTKQAKDIERALIEMNLLTPTTSLMLSSAVVKLGERGLEGYLKQAAKRKKQSGVFSFSELEDVHCLRGRIPCSRSGHSAVVWGSLMILFGGDRAQVSFNDVYGYDLRRLS